MKYARYEQYTILFASCLKQLNWGCERNYEMVYAMFKCIDNIRKHIQTQWNMMGEINMYTHIYS